MNMSYPIAGLLAGILIGGLEGSLWLGAAAGGLIGRALRQIAGLEQRVKYLEGWLHRYVSADPTVAVEGTPFPVAAPASSLTAFPLLAISRAAAAATRAQPADVGQPGATRDVFLRLAARDGWRDAARLAVACDMTPHGVRKNLRKEGVPGLDAAALSLGDPRLLITTCPPLCLSSYARGNLTPAASRTVPSELRPA